MKKKRFIIKQIKSNGKVTKIKLEKGLRIELRPFLYLKPQDALEFIPSIHSAKEIYKVFIDGATGENKKVKICPPYEQKEVIYIPPHKFEVLFRERNNAKDWDKVRSLERFHYRGKGLNKIVGRRTVLIAEMKGYGVVGYGVLSAVMAVARPRFELLETNFTEQMRSKLINRIVRIPRIVIHPEFRGINLGVLMAKHLVQYVKGYWDINSYTPIMIEVIAAMTEYHRFFEKAGFIRAGNTSGYSNGIVPQYGNGSFAKRQFKNYDFMKNQKSKPYLIFPLDKDIRKKVSRYVQDRRIVIKPSTPILKKPILFKNVSVKYKVNNGLTNRTDIIKEAFGVDSEQAFSTIFEDLSFSINPGDVILITGASGSGKSTIIRLLISKWTTLRKNMEINGKLINRNIKDFGILNVNSNKSIPLIDQIKENENVKDAIEILNSVGLSEAHLYIKRPNQISDGQRYRFAVAKLCASGKSLWIADEFCSALNPEMAAIVSKGLRKVAYKYGTTLILAAPHTDYFISSLLPNKLIKLRWGMKSEVYSLFATVAPSDDKFLSLTISNNGNTKLTGIKIGFININGLFDKKFHRDSIEPKQSLNIILKMMKGCVLIVETKEGVGEIFFTQKVTA